MGLDCSTGCGECRCICAIDMYANITEDNEYDEETSVVILLMQHDYYVLVYRINRNNQMVK